MMPTCQYKNCKRVAETSIGRLRVGPDPLRDEEVIYLCKKHANKIRKQLQINWENKKWTRTN